MSFAKLEHDPDALLNLAADAFGDYLTGVVQNWLDYYTVLGVEWMQWFAENVHAALGNAMLYPHVANEVTARLLRQLDDCIVRNKGPAFLGSNHGNSYRLALSHLTSALVHPAVTHLDLFNTNTYYKHSAVDKLMRPFVSEMLKVLRMKNYPFHFEQFSLPNLQELTLLTVCSDSLLEWLWVTCGNIRKLDVSHSIEVTDYSVQFLVKFPFLEKMNVRETSITEEGLTQLLAGLSKNKDSEGVSLTKSFGCSYLNPGQLQILVDNFRKLINFEMEHVPDDFDVSLLRTLENLQSLALSCFGDVQNEILEVIGHQLKQLRCSRNIRSVLNNTPDESCCIFKYCPSLISVSLEIHCNSHSPEMTPQTNYKSLKVVNLTVWESSDFLSCVLSHCTNVRVLKLKCIDVNSNAVATAMLQNNPLEHLEELHWWSWGGEPLLPEVGRQIVTKCKNLKVMYGNIWWSRRRSRKLWYDNSGVFMAYLCFRSHPRLI